MNPNITDEGTIMVLAFLSSLRRVKGVKRCTAMVGGMHEALGTKPEIAIPLRPSGTDTARDTLAGFCQQCRRCDLGRQ